MCHVCSLFIPVVRIVGWGGMCEVLFVFMSAFIIHLLYFYLSLLILCSSSCTHVFACIWQTVCVVMILRC